MASEVVVAPDGTRLCARRFGGSGRLFVLCLHGLGGHAGEWATRARHSLERSLRSWPVPFGSRAAAICYFTDRGLAAGPWAEGLERGDDGWWPRFDVDVLVETLRDADGRTYWDEWESIRCPILIVRGANGTMPPDHAQLIASRARSAKLIEIQDAGHDVHLEQPDEWADVLTSFVRSLA